MTSQLAFFVCFQFKKKQKNNRLSGLLANISYLDKLFWLYIQFKNQQLASKLLHSAQKSISDYPGNAKQLARIFQLYIQFENRYLASKQTLTGQLKFSSFIFSKKKQKKNITLHQLASWNILALHLVGNAVFSQLANANQLARIFQLYIQFINQHLSSFLLASFYLASQQTLDSVVQCCVQK